MKLNDKNIVIELIKTYIKEIDKNIDYYYNINEEQITKEEAKKLDELISCKVMQKLMLYSLLEEVENISEHHI